MANFPHPRASFLTGTLILSICSLLAGAAYATDRYVSLSGRDITLIGRTNPCDSSPSPCRTIQHAIGQSGSADIIRVQSGEYIERLTLSGAYSGLVIQGGWSFGFDTRSDDPFLTRLNGSSAGRILDIAANGVFSSVTIQSFTFYHGAVVGGGEDGGAIRLIASSGADAELIIESCDFIENDAARYGGAIYTANASATLSVTILKSVFLGNSAGSNGGAIEIRTLTSAPTQASLTNNIVAGNTSGNWGGGIFLIGGPLTVELTNNTITGNTANAGGALVLDSFYNETSTVDITNSTLSNNISGNDVLIYEVDNATYDSMAIINASHSNMGRVTVNNGAGGEGVYNDDGTNMNVDPGFVDVSQDDYHLSASSPLIDAGICFEIRCFPRPFPLPPLCTRVQIAPLDDFEDDPRPEESGGLCDIGADEYVPEPTQNLVPNPGFDNDAMLAGWSSIDPTSEEWSTLDRLDAQDSGSIRIESAVGISHQVEFQVEVDPDLDYEGSVWVYTPSGQTGTGGGRTLVTTYSDASCTVFAEFVRSPVSTTVDQWEFVSLEGAWPADVRCVRFLLQTVVASEQGEVASFYDDVRFVPEPGPIECGLAGLAALAWLWRRQVAPATPARAG